MIATTEREQSQVDYHVLPHQAAVIKSETKLTFLGAGVGAGKTDIGTIWTLRQIENDPHGTLTLLCANTYAQLYDSTLRNVIKNLKRFGIPHMPTELPRSHSPLNMRVWVKGKWHEILCRSLDHYETLSGIEAARAWLDEVWQTKEEAVNLVMARCRDTRVKNRILLTTTLDDPSTWMYSLFVEKYDPGLMTVSYASSYANAANLPEDYIDHMKHTCSERLFQRMVLAKWVSLEAGQIYHAFDRKLHEDPTVEFDPALPILWTLDFNIGENKPMSSALCQIKKGPSPKDPEKIRLELHVFDELVLDTTDTNDAVAEFKERQWYSECAGVAIYGDASGRAKDTRSKTTDYKIITKALEDDEKLIAMKVPKANPPLRDSHNAANGLLRSADGDVRVKIHPRCRTLLKGLETVKLKKGAQYLELETREQHVTTAWRYLVSQEFPIVKKLIRSRHLRLA